METWYYVVESIDGDYATMFSDWTRAESQKSIEIQYDPKLTK